jgi:hypothetical protein
MTQKMYMISLLFLVSFVFVFFALPSEREVGYMDNKKIVEKVDVQT